MNVKKIIATLLAAGIVCAGMPLTSGAAEIGAIDYTEYVGTIGNPGIGYTSTVWAVCKPGKTPVYSPSGDVMLFFIDIGAFSSGANGVKAEDGTYTPGQDYDLDDEFFAAWDTTLANCRKNGCMVSLRFRYDAEGKDDPEPASFEQVLRHVEQIKDSGLLEKYADIIAFVECGFVGKWGEQHGGKYVSQDYKAQLLEAMLRAVPAPIPVTVRTPDIFAKWAGIERKQLSDTELIDSLTTSDYSADIQADRPRIGLYNDGYMGSSSDLGTFADRAVETDWLNRQTLTSYYGGEFSGSIDYAKEFETYLPENSIPEMYKTHLSYINGNIFQLYKDYTFSEKYTVEGVDNSAYYGQNVFQFIRDHLGYRFVLRSSEVTDTVQQGGEVKVDLTVENTGFANVIPGVTSSIVLEKDGVYAYAPAQTDCRQWRSCTTSSETISFRIPDSLPEGDWNVCLKLSMGTPADVRSMTSRSIRFANNGVWMSSVGANRLGTVKVTAAENKGTDNSLRVTESDDKTPAYFYTVNGKTVVDGIDTSPYEWTDDMLTESHGSGEDLWIKADEANLYVKSSIPMNGAAAPVYNLQLKNEDDGESYWMYFSSNGFIYFNHGAYMGSQCKWSEDMVEFRVPFEVMGLKPGTKINTVRVFMQDSGNDWKLMSDVTADKAQVPSDFCVISAKNVVRMAAGESYSCTVLTELAGDAVYSWSRNGEPIEGADSDTLVLESIAPEDAGAYEVTITSDSGIVKTVTAFELTVAEGDPETVPGDANCDGTLSIADAAAIMQFLGNKDRYPLGEQGELNADVDGAPGITTRDAQVIQCVFAGLTDASELPLKK